MDKSEIDSKWDGFIAGGIDRAQSRSARLIEGRCSVSARVDVRTLTTVHRCSTHPRSRIAMSQLERCTSAIKRTSEVLFRKSTWCSKGRALSQPVSLPLHEFSF